VEGKGIQQRGMEEAVENGNDLSHSARGNGRNECRDQLGFILGPCEYLATTLVTDLCGFPFVYT